MLSLLSFSLSALNVAFLVANPSRSSAPINAAAAVFCFGVGLLLAMLGHK